MKNIEVRMNNFSVIGNENTSGKLVVTGYVNETGKYSHLLNSKRKKFREKIQKGAFERALAKGNEVHFFAEHDYNKILASTRNGSLKLVEDENGLLMTAEISETSFGRDYYTLIKDGILKNMSFGFNVESDKWRRLNDGTYTREITDLTLYEVSVVTEPAYPQSVISARSFNTIEDVEIPDDIEITTEPEENTEETTEKTMKTEDEKRAYVSGIWGDRDVLNITLDIMGNISSLLQHNKQQAVKIIDEQTESSLLDIMKTCSDIIININTTSKTEDNSDGEDNTISVNRDMQKKIEELQERTKKIIGGKN